MPRRMFDFKCEEGHTTERFIDTTIESVECEVCGEKAVKIISPVACKLDAISGDFPGESIKWARKHENSTQSQ